MVIDSSAVVSILLAEPSAHAVRAAMWSTRRRSIGAPTVLEASMVVEARRGAQATDAVATLLDYYGVKVVAFDRGLANLSIRAWRRFGKGNHPAALNLGDCLAYAVARRAGEPLLCLGEDFVQTDLEVVSLAA